MASESHQVTFNLYTDVRRFSSWAVSVIHELDGCPVSTERGHLTLQRGGIESVAYSNADSCRWPVDAVLTSHDSNAQPKSVGTVLALSAWSPATDRVSATIEYLSDLQPIADLLAGSIADTWPESVSGTGAVGFRVGHDRRVVERALQAIGAPVATAILEGHDPLLARRLQAPTQKHKSKCNRGSGFFQDASHYEQTVVAAMLALLKAGNRKLTQEKMAEYFAEHTEYPHVDTDGREFRRWDAHYGLTWAGLQRRARAAYSEQTE